MIQLDQVTKTYSLAHSATVAAVNGVSLEIARGEFVIIVGRSGSGKTTLLNLLAGLTQPTGGKVLFEGKDLWQLNDAEQSALRNQKIGFVFQFPSLLPTLTVYENVLLPTIFGSKTTNGARSERARQLLTQVGLAEKLNVYPRQLSAGQQQRVVIARALINQPQLLLADEPTSNLDETTELEILELFRQLHHRLDLTIVMVTHTRQLIPYGTRSLEMAQGVLVNGQGVPAQA